MKKEKMEEERMENQPKYKLGWHYGTTELLEDIVSRFNCIELEGFIVRDVKIEKAVVEGTWEYIYKVIDKE